VSSQNGRRDETCPVSAGGRGRGSRGAVGVALGEAALSGQGQSCELYRQRPPQLPTRATATPLPPLYVSSRRPRRYSHLMSNVDKRAPTPRRHSGLPASPPPLRPAAAGARVLTETRSQVDGRGTIDENHSTFSRTSCRTWPSRPWRTSRPAAARAPAREHIFTDSAHKTDKTNVQATVGEAVRRTVEEGGGEKQTSIDNAHTAQTVARRKRGRGDAPSPPWHPRCPARTQA